MRNTSTPVEPGTRIVIKTFGVLHAPAPRENNPAISVDLTTALRNPANDPAMIQMTGLDAKVRSHVLATPGAEAIINDLVQQVFATGHNAHVFCQGGRHRSVAVAEESAARLRAHGLIVEVQHRDIDKPVKQKA